MGALMLAAGLLTACTSGGAVTEPDRGPGGEEQKFIVCRSAWFGNALERGEKWRDPVANAHPARPLSPNDPWVGTVGVRSGIDHAYEYGVGLCVPDPTSRNNAAPVGRSVGLGCWLTFDF